MMHPLCDQTVTLYRRQGDSLCRQVLTDCYFRYETALQHQGTVPGLTRPFRLLTEQEVKIGDRIFPGVGPEIAPEDWAGFLPERQEGLCQVSRVKPRCFPGQAGYYDAG